MTAFTERNRKNSEKSCGPRTDAGKARSSQNALKNGLYSISARLPSEDQELYLAHSAAFVADLHPEGAAQQALVEIVSDNTWRLRRVRVLVEAQTSILLRLVDSADQMSLQAYYKDQSETTRALESLSRLEQRMQNGMLKALKQLKELQKQAPGETDQSEAAGPESGFVPTPQNKAAAATANVAQSEPEVTPEAPITPAFDNQDAQKVAA
jgi:hypothetical protein